MRYKELQRYIDRDFKALEALERKGRLLLDYAMKGLQINDEDLIKFHDIIEVEERHVDTMKMCSYEYCSNNPTHVFSMDVLGFKYFVPFCEKHVYMIENLSRLYEGTAHEILEKDEIPVIRCFDDGKNWFFFCKYCQEIHRHGRNDDRKYGGTDMHHKVDHCRVRYSPYKYIGYYIKLSEDCLQGDCNRCKNWSFACEKNSEEKVTINSIEK